MKTIININNNNNNNNNNRSLLFFKQKYMLAKNGENLR